MEVLDTEKADEWLVRKQSNKEEVCYIPVELLLGKKTKPKEEESEEEEEEEVKPEKVGVKCTKCHNKKLVSIHVDRLLLWLFQCE